MSKAAKSVIGSIKNNTSEVITFVSQNLQSGSWSHPPTETIRPSSSGMFAVKARGIFLCGIDCRIYGWYLWFY